MRKLNSKLSQYSSSKMPPKTTPSSTAGPHEPKRTRGRLRVAAIMEAGVEVFTEKGYDAATMTEIASRSGTAIGSLYRFFPSKEYLADALLFRYAKQLASRLDELKQRAGHMTRDQLAETFVDFFEALESQRSFAITLVDARGGSDDNRTLFREAMRGGIADILRKSMPWITPAKSKVKAIVLLSVLKGVANAAQEVPAVRRLLLTEIRELVRQYLVSDQN